MPVKELIDELLEFVDGVVDDLGSRKHIEKVHNIFTSGTGADRQLKVFKETGSLIEVVKYIEQSFLQ
jgi:carboxylate-amine ligase